MLRLTTLVALGLLLSGCAMPVPMKIASWALDGVSYITTQKSVMDHGLSALSGQDCKVLRLATEKSACRPNSSGVAFNEDLSPHGDIDLASPTPGCDIAAISQDLPDNGTLNRCAARLIEQYGKDGAVAHCDRRIGYLVEQRQTDDAAIWIGIQVAVQNLPADA